MNALRVGLLRQLDLPSGRFLLMYAYGEGRLFRLILNVMLRS